ncbi:MAG: PH domain-containing protein [Actinomycetota bacterium]|nr:PH domain-containing protein [Actinomycetota bacterium]
MSFPDRHLTEGEVVVAKFRPHWRLLFMPIVWVVLAAAAIVVVYLEEVPPRDSTIDLITAGVIVLALIPLAVMPFISWWFTLYILTDERLITRQGVIARSGIEIPLENISNVLFEQSVIERMLRSGDLLVESAGESGQSEFNDIPQPEEFQALLYKTREERAKHLGQPPVAPVVAAPDVTARLEQLSRLHREGTINDEEFTAQRQKLLDQI